MNKNKFKLKTLILIPCSVCAFSNYNTRREPCKSCTLNSELESLNDEQLKEKIVELIQGTYRSIEK